MLKKCLKNVVQTSLIIMICMSECDTLLLADVFEKFRNTLLIYTDLILSYFLSAPRLAWQACLKKTEVKL